ncbi:hypothetical protein PS15p_211975 [Mucor circinelloides]
MARSFLKDLSSKKPKSKAVQEQHPDTKLLEQLSNIETRMNQKYAEFNGRLEQQKDIQQQSTRDFSKKLEAFETILKQEIQAQHLVLDSKSLLLELALKSREACVGSQENLRAVGNSRVDQTLQMASLSTAAQGIADATNTFNALLPRVIALEYSQATSQESTTKFTELEKQIKNVSLEVSKLQQAFEEHKEKINETVDDGVQRLRGDHFDLKALIKFNRTALETKMGELEADIRGHLAIHNHQITDTAKLVSEASVFVKQEFDKVQALVENASAFCSGLKQTTDLLGGQVQYLVTRLLYLEQWFAVATTENEDVQSSDQIVLY